MIDDGKERGWTRVFIRLKDPVPVEAGEKLTLNMNYTLKPDKTRLTQLKPADGEVEVVDDTFIAPDKKGTYIYDCQTDWMDKNDADISRSDASYVFKIKVK